MPELGGSVDAIQELLADAAATGAGLHIVHIGSSGGDRVPLLLEMIDGARRNGVDVTTEVYPYTAWSTFIGAALGRHRARAGERDVRGAER